MPKYIPLKVLLKEYPAGTEFSYVNQYGDPVKVLDLYYTGMGELVFSTEYGQHYATPDELILVD